LGSIKKPFISSMAKMTPENRVKFIEELEILSEKYK
jgi:hypothetical protein